MNAGNVMAGRAGASGGPRGPLLLPRLRALAGEGISSAMPPDDRVPGPMPVLTTKRLRLRPFTLLDAPELQRRAGAPEVAAGTLRIPHPYPDGLAEAWVLSHPGGYARGEELTLAITRLEDGLLLGAIGLAIAGDDARAELGYWIGVPYWGRGYATEAAAAILAHGFRSLGLARIHACHFAGNVASGRVLQKIGMTYEGRQRSHVRKDGRLQDLELYGMLRQEFEVSS